MVLTDEGPGFAIYYQDIRPALIRTIPPGAPRFRGRIVNGNYVIGDAFVYTKFCFGKPFPYHVSGVIHDGIIDLRGPAAVVDPRSWIVGLRANSDNAHVMFAELAPPPPVPGAPQAPSAPSPTPPPVVVAPPAPTPPVVVPPVVVPPVVIQAPAPVIVPAPAPVIVSPQTTTTTVNAPQEPRIVIAPSPRPGVEHRTPEPQNAGGVDY